MFKSKIRLLSVVLALLLVSISVAVAQDSSSDDKVRWPDLGGREVAIAMTNDYPPYQYYDENKQLVGWDYDTLRDICKLLNCVPVFKETSWDGELLALSKGEFDMGAGGITYTAERAKSVAFSQLFQTYDEALLVRDNETRFTTSAELNKLGNFVVGTQVGTTNEITAQNLFGQDKVKSYDQFPVAIQALLNGDIDAVVIDRPAAEGFIAAQGKMKTLPESLAGVEGIAFAISPSSGLVNPVNAAISALQASGRWDELEKKWFKK